MAEHMLADTEHNYMEFKNIALKKPLNSVKRTDKKNDTLVIPDNLLPIISRFFEAEDIEYKTIENPALYPADKLKAGLKAYEDCSPTFFIRKTRIVHISIRFHSIIRMVKAAFWRNHRSKLSGISG